MENEDGKIIIHINTAYNVNLAAKEVNNIFNINAKDDAKAAITEALGANQTTLSHLQGEPEENIDITPIRTEILNYVSRVRPLLTDETKSTFMKMWEEILDLPAVETLVYKTGKQQGTNFNRNLVANILYHLRTRKIYKDTYKSNYNGASMTEALEGDKDHPVKHALREDPPADVCEAIDIFLKEKYS